MVNKKFLVCALLTAFSTANAASDINYPTFKFSSTVKVDQTKFFDSKDETRGLFPSGGNIRSVDNSFSGNIDKDFSYNISVSLTGGVSLDDAFITYKGLGPNTSISVGHVPPSYDLEAATSSKWVQFLERSLSANAFGKDLGIGLFGQQKFDFGQVSVSLLQPRADISNIIPYDKGSDRFNVSGRVTLLPYQSEGSLLHVGASAVAEQLTYQDHAVKTNYLGNVRFKTRPEVRARATASLLDTGAMKASAYYLGALEAATQMQSFTAQAKYTLAKVKGLKVLPDSSVNKEDYNFSGWHVEAAYLLTGEVQEYKKSSGAFGSVTPESCYGALGLAVRYSALDLNSGNEIKGGSENNITVGLNWYVNPKIKLMANYVRANIKPSKEVQYTINNKINDAERTLDAFSVRFQAII